MQWKTLSWLVVVGGVQIPGGGGGCCRPVPPSLGPCEADPEVTVPLGSVLE